MIKTIIFLQQTKVIQTFSLNIEFIALTIGNQ